MTHGRMPLAVPSATHSRISGSLCTESFQRYGSSRPTLKMPPMGLLPITARYSFARRPLAHGGVKPAPRLIVGELDRRQLAGGLEVRRSIRDEARLGVARANRLIPLPPERRQSRLLPLEELPAERIAGIGRARQLRAGGVAIVLLAVNAEAVATLRCPAIRKDAVHLVFRDDLAVDLIHELEVVGPERARDPEIGVGPMPQRAAGPRDRNPVGMRDAHLVAHRVRIRASDDAHAESAASDHERAEGIGLPEPRAAMVQRHLGRIVRDDAASAERGGIGVEAAEVVEPELRVEPAGVVLDERQLHPAHRPVEPAGERVERGGRPALAG